MKGQYNIYPFFTQILHREARRAFGKITVIEALRRTFHSMEMRQSLNYLVLADEYFWQNQSKVVIFPESVDILERLTQAKFSIEKSAGISFPHDAFLLAFPKDYMIAGIPAMGCMVSYMYRSDRFERVHQPFFKDMKLGIPKFADDDSKRGLYISYFSPYDKGMIIRACIPEDIIAEALKAKDYNEYADIVGSYDPLKVNSFAELNDRDKKYQFDLFQIITRVGIYATNTDGLRPGYPHVRPKHLEPKGLSYTDYTLGMSKRTVGAHYRSWHFRQLTHKKYYQGEHKKKPIGSRIVFVKDTMVSLDVEAETLE